MKRTHRVGVAGGIGLSLVLALGACGGSTAETGSTIGTASPKVDAVAATTEQLPDAATIRQLFTQWNATLATGDPQKVTALYAPDGVLLPTLSKQVRTDQAQRVDYFTEFLKKKPSGKITSSTVRIMSAETAIDTGTYDFTVTLDGERQVVPARYTFVYELVGGKWLIVNHHSSVMPED